MGQLVDHLIILLIGLPIGLPIAILKSLLIRIHKGLLIMDLLIGIQIIVWPIGFLHFGNFFKNLVMEFVKKLMLIKFLTYWPCL